MSGLEAAGLAIALFSVASKGVASYRGRVTTRDVSFLANSLENLEAMFSNSIERLLNSAISSDELAVLLGDLQGLAWKDLSLNDRVRAKLGQAADGILGKVEDIYKTILGLQRKLPVSMQVNFRRRQAYSNSLAFA